jgi:hypothetical protein
MATVGTGGTLGDACGVLVDVSAGGVRVRFPHPPALAVGRALVIDLSVADTKAPPGALPVRLKGRAELLRLVEEPDGIEAGLRFLEPLKVTEAFRSPTLLAI